MKTSLKSSKAEYRIITQPGNKYTYEVRFDDSDQWYRSCFLQNSIKEVFNTIKNFVEMDDFKTTIIDLEKFAQG